MEFGLTDIFPLGIFMLVGAVALLRLAWNQVAISKAREVWTWVGAKRGLAMKNSLPLARPRLAGVIAGLKVTIDTVRRGGRHKRTYTRFMVEIDTPPAGLTATREDLLTQLGGALGFGDLRIGDPEFDRAVRLRGAEAAAVALLDAARRDRLREFVVGRHGRIEHGLLCMELPTLLTDEKAMLGHIEYVVDLAKDLGLRGVRLPPRLRRNAEADPCPAVRRRNLELLLREFPEAPERAEACRAVLAEAESPPDLVLLASRPLGPEGWPALQRLAFAPGLEPEIAAAALRHLALELPPDRRLALLEHAMESEAPALHREARERIVELGYQPPTAVLLRWLAAPGAQTVAYAAQCILLRDGAPAEGPLLFALNRPEVAVRLAVTAALGKLGTLAAVEPLRTLAADAPLLDGGLRAATRAAVKEIQSRLGAAAGAGQLSLARTTGEAGALSLAARDAGELSLAPEGVPATAAEATAAAESAPADGPPAACTDRHPTQEKA
ncbi:MAG: hypothetical protein HZA54_16030 [Planctomycetes bacterium]|nr:hypothetical protein [Planctomycetota bacterium]